MSATGKGSRSLWKSLSARIVPLLVLSSLLMVGCSDDDSSGPQGNACSELRRFELGSTAYGERQYSVYFPSDFDQANPPSAAGFPVLYAFHGFYGSSTGFAMQVSGGQLCELAEREDMIVVFPQGSSVVADLLNFEQAAPFGYRPGEPYNCTAKPEGQYCTSGFISSWNFLPSRYYGPTRQDNFLGDQPVCNLPAIEDDAYAGGYAGVGLYPTMPGCLGWDRLGCGWTACFDDSQFVLDIQDQINGNYNGDRSRQYLLGFSNGSMMVNKLACEYPDRFAAAISNSGTTASNSTGELGMVCDGAKLAENPISSLMLSGANDQTVPIRDAGYPGTYGSGPPAYDYFMKMSAAASQMAERMGCGGAVSVLPQGYQGALGGLSCVEFSGCGPENDRVEYCIWGTDPDSAVGSSSASSHIYMGCNYGGGYCVETSVQGDITAAPGQTGYPECLVDRQNPYGCYTRKGTEFMWSFLESAGGTD